MKNFRKKAAPAFVLLAGASMSLAGVTYAWFNQNTKAEVSNINVGVVDASGGIAIAKDINGTFKTKLDFDADPDQGENTDFSSTLLDPLSANKLTSDKTMFDFYKGQLNALDSSKIMSSKPNPVTGYVTFDLFFENVSGSSRYVFFDYSKLTSSYTHASDYADLVKEMLPTQVASQYSVRIGFIDMGNAINKVNARTATGSFVIVEPDGLRHTDYAEGIIGSGLKEDTTYALVDSFTDYKAIRPNADVSGKMVAQETYSIDECGIQNPFSKPLFEAKPGYTEIKVVIWLEGQDIDNENSVSNLDFSINLKFDTKTMPELVKSAKTKATSEIDTYGAADTFVDENARPGYVSTAKTAISNVSEETGKVKDVKDLLDAAEGNIDNLLRTNTKSNAKTELDNYAAAKKVDRPSASDDIDAIVGAAKTAIGDIGDPITGCTDVNGVNLEVKNAKEDIDEAVELWAYKDAKIAELVAYHADWEEMTGDRAALVTTHTGNIEDCETKAAVDGTLAAAKLAIDGLGGHAPAEE